MSKKRQRAILDPQGAPAAQLTTLSKDYPDGYVIPVHFHREDQLVFASKGVMTITTEQGIWVVPPQRAVWIPGNQSHTIAMSGTVQMRTLYFRPGFARSVPRSCFVLNVTPLLRELILRACERKAWSVRRSRERPIIELALDELEVAESIALRLPHPEDPRALRVAEILAKDPADARTLGELCKRAGASKRTIERVFVEETGMTFGKWRQQLKLLHAMRLLASGEKVTAAALDAGYASPSAFIAVFKKAFGETPNRYFT